MTHTPAAVQTAQAPPWLLAAIEKEWAAPSTRHPALSRGAVFTHFRVWLRARWPNALQATLHRGNVYRGARLPVQLAEVLAIVPASLRNITSPAWWRSLRR